MKLYPAKDNIYQFNQFVSCWSQLFDYFKLNFEKFSEVPQIDIKRIQ